MSEKALWLSSKIGDAATLIASSESSSLPVSHLQTVEPERRFRSTAVPTYITLDLGSEKRCTELSLDGHNLSAAATLRVRGAASAAAVTAAPVVDTGAVSAWPTSGKPTDDDWPEYLSLVRWTTANSYRYWRLDIADVSNADGYIEAARLMIGRGFQGTYNVDLNPSLGLTSPDVQKRSDYGKTFTDPRGVPSRSLVLPLSTINHRDMMDALFELQRYCGLARDFVFSLDPSATTDFHKYSMRALFASSAQFDAQPLFDATGQVWRSTITINELV